MTYDYVAGERAELVVGQSVEPVTVLGRNGAGYYEVRVGAGRQFGISGSALRPALPDDFEMKDASGDTVHVSCQDFPGGQYRVRISANVPPADLTPDQADKLADAVRAMARAIRGREQS